MGAQAYQAAAVVRVGLLAGIQLRQQVVQREQAGQAAVVQVEVALLPLQAQVPMVLLVLQVQQQFPSWHDTWRQQQTNPSPWSGADWVAHRSHKPRGLHPHTRL